MGAFVVLRGLAFIGDAVSHAAFPGSSSPTSLGHPAVHRRRRRGGRDRPRHRRRRPARWRSASIPPSVSSSPGCSPSASCCSARSRATSPTCSATCSATSSGSRSRTSSRSRSSAAIVLLVVAILRKELLYASFDPAGAAASGLPVVTLEYLLLGLIGVTIVVSIQAVGIIMVVAMLVTPAATGNCSSTSSGTSSRSRSGSSIVVGRQRPVPELLPERRLGRLDRARRDAAVRARAALLAEVGLAGAAMAARRRRWPPGCLARRGRGTPEGRHLD